MISPTLLYRGTLGSSAATVATTSVNGQTTINSIVVTNKTANARVFSITVGGVYFAYLMPIPAYQTITLDVRQVANPGTAIQAWADATTAVDLSISCALQTPTLYLGSGTGSPEGVLTANQGAEWVQTNDSELTYLKWRKLTGSGNTGWYPDFEGRWKTYTPTLTASTTNPTNWTQTGYYTQSGKVITAKWALVAGASVTAGSGTYRVATPVSANLTVRFGTVMAYCFDNSTNTKLHCQPQPDAAGYFQMWYPATYPTGTNTAVTNTTFTWAQNDEIVGAITYEAA